MIHDIFRFCKTIFVLALIIFVFGMTSSAFSHQDAQAESIQTTAGTQESQSTTQEAAKETEVYAFGYDIFKAPPEPIIEGPVDETYLISPRDELLITVWGELNLNYLLAVSEDGYIDIPDEGGRVYTNGVTLGELKGLVTGNLSQIYSSYINADNPASSTAFVDVRITKARKLLVYVVGEVQNQGMYTIGSSVATVLNLLINAGGVKESGSLREIKVRRANGTVNIIDIYDFILGNIETKKSRLGYGDFVIVPLKIKSVAIKGEVKKPGKFELVGDEGIKDLIQFAGGLNPNAYLDRCQVRRFELNVGEKFIDLNLTEIFDDPQQDFALSDGDELTIFKNIVVRRRMVEIRGAGIKRPGIFPFFEGMTLSDLIESAEGLTEFAYLERIDLVRTEEDFSKKLTFFPLSDLFSKQEPGRYAFSGDQEKNIILKELDQVTIYSSFEMRGKDKLITIEGHVREPGTYVLPDNMTLFDLVFSRGGFQDEEFKRKAYLDLAHVFRKVPGEIGEKILTFNLAKLLAGDKEENMSLEDSDRVKIYSYEVLETKPFVTISGLVNNPGTYDLAEDLTLEDLILLAGGLRPDAYKVEAIIGRMEPSEIVEDRAATLVLPVEEDYASKPAEEKTPLKVYDRIIVRNLSDWEPLPVVSIEGQVKYPGNYSFETKQERISSAVFKAGGLKQGAFPEGAYLLRSQYIIEMTNSGGRESVHVVINLREALNNPGGPHDMFLRDGDQVYIPGNPGTVEVKGAVQNPSVLQFREGKKLSYYIGQSGGFRRDSDSGNTVIYLPNKSAVKRKKFLIFGKNPTILPGSTINVPLVGDKDEVDVVEIRGAVQKPMMIQFRKGEKLSYYIDLCGGFRPNADLKNLLVHFADGKFLESLGGASFNPYILPGTVVEVPFVDKEDVEKIGFVDVLGAVKNPMSIRFREEETLDYYIKFCGGFSETADVENIVIHLPDGKILERKGALAFDPVIVPGSVIEVPFKENK